MRLVAWLLRQRLVNLPHLLRDADYLIQQIADKRIPAHHRLVKIDIKDYFMSGTHAHLSRDASELVSMQVRKPFRDFRDCILMNQYVSFPAEGGGVDIQSASLQWHGNDLFWRGVRCMFLCES